MVRVRRPAAWYPRAADLEFADDRAPEGLMSADQGISASRAVELVRDPAPAEVVPVVSAPLAARPATGRRLRDSLWFVIVFLVALLIFCSVDSGGIFFDTKLGVDINASEFLVRLWSLWNPLEWLGSLQDQYIGYVIPMAPFYLVGQLLHVPIWLIERLWVSLIIAFGFTGMVKLGRALGIGNDSSRLLAGAVFALWPTFTILIGSTSASALPGLAVPWAILPLVRAVQGRYTARRAAALSGLAIAAMSGVNAVCTLVVLVLPAFYILTHTRSRQRVRLSAAWIVAVIAATTWWAVPLLLQGRYAFNFLPYIEQSATTTATLSAAAVLRGTGTWTAYFNLGGTVWLSSGWTMVTAPMAILASAVVSATGLAGLARRDMPERRWLSICAGLAAAVALAGYYGPLGGPLHGPVDNLLNATLAPFRSLYKVEPVIGVAIALGCAHAIDRLWRMSLPVGRAKVYIRAVTAPVIALTLIGLAWPQLTGQVLHPGSFQQVPEYWYQAADYLAKHSPTQTALVVPDNPHGQFTWGETIDDPLEPLATSPWVERGLVPYGGAGSQVMLQTAEQAIESGQQVPGLAAYLARAGIRYVVVRNDTSTTVFGYTPPQVVNETLALSGFRPVASFGPEVPAAPGYPDVSGYVPGYARSYPSVQIFAVPASPATGPVVALPVADTALVNGGPDALLQLDAQGVLASQPTVIAGQKLPVQPSSWFVTDGQRRADTDFGTVDGYQSYTYTATGKNPVDDPLGAAGDPPRQLLPVTAAGHQTVAVLAGAASVTASSAGTWTNETTQYSPANAFDGDPSTAWVESNPTTPVGQWVEVTLHDPIDMPAAGSIRLFDQLGRPVVTALQVTTAAGSAITLTADTTAAQPLRVPPGQSRWLRVTILGASNVTPDGPGAGISDVYIPGIRVTTYLQPAEDVAAGQTAPVTSYSFAQQAASAYTQTDAASVPASPRMYRTFVTPQPATYNTQLQAVPVAGRALTTVLAGLSKASTSSFTVTASSSWDSLPELGPDSMYSGTGRPWIAGAGDSQPSLTYTWRRLRTIDEIVLHPATGVAAAPTAVVVRGDHGVRRAVVGAGGVVRISPALRTHTLKITFTAAFSANAGNTAAGQPAQLPVGLASVSIPGLAGIHPPSLQPGQAFRLACGQGPYVYLDGRRYPTAVTGTVGDLIDLTSVRLELCSPGQVLTLEAGRHWLSTGSSSDFTVTNVNLTNGPAASTTAAEPSRSVHIVSWGADNRSVRIGSGPASYLEIHENADRGWTATLDGHPLQSVTLDGWQQAFVVPAGQGGTITLTFQPATIYHASLIIGALLLLLLLAFSIGTGWLRPRRHRQHVADPSYQGRSGPADIFLTPARSILTIKTTPGSTMEPPPIKAGRLRLAPGSAAWAILTLLPLTIVVAVAGGPTAFAVPVLAIVGYRRPRWLPWIAAAAMVETGLVITASHLKTVIGNGPFGAVAQVLALIALTAALLPTLIRRPKEKDHAPGPGPAEDPGLPSGQGQPALL
jgi:arabinofuranan 3-O-arabinosyltransferase